jgi:hypothetical protein
MVSRVELTENQFPFLLIKEYSPSTKIMKSKRNGNKKFQNVPQFFLQNFQVDLVGVLLLNALELERFGLLLLC